uniref:VP11 n=1 Tax=viral metagenome TaxID=1070528 RepID=A0A2V0RIH2_9ZZZZ
MNWSKSINFQPFMMDTRPPLDMIPVTNQLVRLGQQANQRWEMNDRLFFAIKKMNPVFVTGNHIATKYDYTILQIQTQLIATLPETLLFLAFSYYIREYQDKVGLMRYYPVAVKNMIPILTYLKNHVHNNYDTTLNQAYRMNVVNSMTATEAFDLLSGMLATTRNELIQRTRFCPELLNVLNKMSFMMIFGPGRPALFTWKRQG